MTDTGRGDERRVEGSSRQLTFDLAGRPSYDADDFLVSAANSEAHGTIRRWPDWSDRVLLVLGEAGTGKSHLGAIWAALARADTITSESGLAAAAGRERPVALIEDCDRAGFSEADLFHLMNAVRGCDGWLVITARKAPDLWGLKTPDLLSRLRLAVSVRLDQPDPALMRAVLAKQFDDRQIHIEANVVAFAALHCEQSLGAIRSFVAAVDSAALASGRRITRPLAARTLRALHESDEDFGPEPA